MEMGNCDSDPYLQTLVLISQTFSALKSEHM